MMELIALALALVFACWFLIFVMHQAFVRGVGWLDERDSARARQRLHQRRQHPKSSRPPIEIKAATRPPRRAEDDEWAEYIDV